MGWASLHSLDLEKILIRPSWLKLETITTIGCCSAWIGKLQSSPISLHFFAWRQRRLKAARREPFPEGVVSGKRQLGQLHLQVYTCLLHSSLPIEPWLHRKCWKSSPREQKPSSAHTKLQEQQAMPSRILGFQIPKSKSKHMF